MTQRNKALALLAGLGVINSSNALENAPIQEVNTTVQQIHYLSHDRANIAELMQAVEKLTTTVQTLNAQVETNLNRIDKTGFYLLDTLHKMLEMGFNAIKNLFTEEEAYTIYYKTLRPFSNEMTRLNLNNREIRHYLGLFKVVDTGVMSPQKMDAMMRSLDKQDQHYAANS